MTSSRRRFLGGTGAAMVAGASLSACDRFGLPIRREPASAVANLDEALQDWRAVRRLFPLAPDWIDMSAMLLTSHPQPVSRAIERHRRGLDANPVVYFETHNGPLQSSAREAAARYLGVDRDDVALTDSTTMGVALVYHGLRLSAGQEVLTTEQDYYVTHESLRLAASQGSASVRRIPLYGRDELPGIAADTLVDRIVKEIRPNTRVVALTWVHSSTGVKLPVARIAVALQDVNRNRDENDRALLCLDGVHGFGNQDVSFADLGCDFLMAGCHKWLFGPRGTGIVVGTARGWSSVAPTIPSFIDGAAYSRWIRHDPAPPHATTAAAFTPGGFKAYEHLWGLSEAFELHRLIGRARVAHRTAVLATRLKEGLLAIGGVRLRTPMSPELSAGIVAIDIDGISPHQAVAQLRARRIIASVAPYAIPHLRLTPSVRNDEAEIATVLSAVRDVAKRA